ncbi:ABC-type branched-subunit amino acid transport system substrate-binding protein [Pedobacter sp. CG_S7]|uniref:ABC transporter substrate-binding protein n=1 Tax=Pedobacter sp. CG_S7 TaxID=3143930 RepID=UPI003392EE0B
MISVQNHLLPLSGNKYLALIFIGLCMSACSPKVQTIKKATPSEEKKEEVIKPSKKFSEATISLLLPFNLNDFKTRPKNKAEVEKHAMAIDFYQGFKLAIDSVASAGLNFKINVFDSQDDDRQLEVLIKNDKLKGSNLVVGPVFPDGLKYITNYSQQNQVPVVSPLAASQPSEFGNPNLISIVNNIGLHAAKIGDYITKKYVPAQTVVVLVSSKSPDDEVLGSPLRDYFLNKNERKLPFQEYASVFTMETRISKGKKYVVMLSSADQKFVTATIHKLIRMKAAGFDIDLFGHPDWVKQSYTIENLQDLNTVITSSYKVNYNSPAVISFIKKYRKAFDFEPGEYAYKGFDIGFYFAKQLSAYGENYLKHLSSEKYKGLHNTFTFQQDDKFGYINTSLMLLKYKGFALNIIE